MDDMEHMEITQAEETSLDGHGAAMMVTGRMSEGDRGNEDSLVFIGLPQPAMLASPVSSVALPQATSPVVTVAQTTRTELLTQQNLLRRAHDVAVVTDTPSLDIGIFRTNGESDTTKSPLQNQNGEFGYSAPVQVQSAVPYSQECTEDTDDGGPAYREGRHWIKLHCIGGGASGCCFVAQDTATRLIMAVKQPYVCNDTVLNEIDIMRSIRSNNIIKFLGATREKNLNIFMELMEGGSIEGRLKNGGAFAELMICHYVKQLVHGLIYLHGKDIAHRDLKGANILLDRAGKAVRIADFGAAARLADRQKFFEMAGTPPFMAPEVIHADSTKNKCYCLKCDVWSLGCVVIEMATTLPPWTEKGVEYRKYEIVWKVGKSKSPPPIPHFYDADLKDFTICCLCFEREDRPTSSDLLKHNLMISVV